MRAGTFSSSNIYKLMTKGKAADSLGKPALTYIEETRYEMRLGRSLSTDQSSHPALWGTFVESYVNDHHIGLEYELASTERITHSAMPRWTGAPDLIGNDCVGDIKCPQLKNFCELEKSLANDSLRDDFPEYYWQLVSNATLTGRYYAELIVFCPYKEELDAIRSAALEQDDRRFYFIAHAKDEELPYLIKGGHYKNVMRHKWQVTQQNRDELTERVKMAINLLLEVKK
jgi:hypothetical protein